MPPLVTGNDRPVWVAFEAKVLVKKDGKMLTGTRWCAGHEDGLYYRTFLHEDVCNDFVAILNERDEALRRLERALGKKVVRGGDPHAEFTLGQRVRYVGPWEEKAAYREDSMKMGHWHIPAVGTEGKVCNIETWPDHKRYCVELTGGKKSYFHAESLEAI